MTKKFMASNGIHVGIRTANNEVAFGLIKLMLPPGGIPALREFFRAERDEELGRWRYPVDPEWVAIEGERLPNRRTVVLVNERTLEREWLNDLVMKSGEAPKHEAARAYFEARPERKPWEDAKPGEVWAVTIEGTEKALLVDPDQFTDGNLGYDFDDSSITAARRIWPEVAS